MQISCSGPGFRRAVAIVSILWLAETELMYAGLGAGDRQFNVLTETCSQ